MVIVGILFSMISSAQLPIDRHMFMLSNLSTKEGLSSNRVFGIVQDHDGAIWIGTKMGVDRYNGYRVRNYVVSEKSRISDASGHSSNVAIAPNGLIFAYDNKGHISKYNPYIDRFEELYNMQNELSRWVSLNHLLVNADGSMLMAMTQGLYFMSKEGKGHWIVKNVPIECIVNSKMGYLAGTENGIVLVKDVARSKYRLVVSHCQVQSMYLNPLSHLVWVGTFHEGVKVFDVNTWRQLSMPALATLPTNPVRSISPLDNYTMLFGIDGAGVYAGDMMGKTVWPLFDADDKTGSALHGNGVYSICRDSFGNIWIGSYSGGVDMAMPTGNVLTIIRHEYLNQQSLLNNSVNAVIQSPDGLMYFATDRGISVYDARTHSWRHGLYNKVALSLTRTANGQVFVGTYGDGVYAVSPSGDSHKVYSAANGKLKTDYVFSLFTDRQGRVWIGCLDGDLVCMEGDKAHYYPISQVQVITQISNGNIAVGTSNGFYIVNPSTGKTQLYFTDAEAPHIDRNNFVQSLLFADDQHVWIGSDGGGMYYYNLKTRKAINLTTANGLPSNTIYTLANDGRGRIVVSTDHGLALVYPKSHEVVNINYVNGLEREYKRMSLWHMLDGRIVVGSNDGAVIIDPRRIDRLSYRAPLRFTQIEVSGIDPEDIDEVNEDIYKMVADSDVILSHRQNTFLVHFESINFKYQHDILYSYQLEGFDKQWSVPSNSQTARYVNLPPGHYILHVRALSHNDGRIISQHSIEITVREPWYNTWWMWIFYLLVFGAFIHFVWVYYKERLQRRYFDEKINFFIHTAHDIRTPLSLILAPLSDIAKDQELSQRSRYFLDIARNNGNKLLTMITQLLDFQKSDNQDGVMYVQELHVKRLLYAQKAKFQLVADQKDIDIQISDCPENLTVWMDASMADKIFQNLISNAVKYTPEGGKVVISTSVSSDHISFKIADNGIGIPKAAQHHIFQNFYRAENAVNSKVAGSGLGLMLARRLVRRHGGKLTFVSEEGRGTTFTLVLPLGNEHLRKYISENPVASPSKGVRDEGSLAQTAFQVLLKTEKKTKPSTTLLFVDDNDELRTYIRLSFSDYYHVIDVASAEEALEYLKGGGLCDFVVSDVMMPGMQGDELCRIIKSNKETSWLPVILLTAKTGRDSIIEGLEVGADDFITKPFDTELLRTKIDSILANRLRLSQYYISRSIEMVKDSSAEGEPEESLVVEQEEDQISKVLDVDDQEFIDKATRIVLDNLSDADFNIDQLCAEMAMSRTLFYGRLKSLTSQAPQEFIRLIKLERAAILLKQGNSVLDVSVRTGFVNVKYFSTLFKKHFGVSPSKYE